MDHIANMLVSITNASKAHKDHTIVMHNNLCEKIIGILVQQGYCSSFEVIGDIKKTIKINLKYTNDGKGVIRSLKRVSKQSLRSYSKSAEIKDVKNGLGLLIVTTNKGIMTGREAKAKNLGGEVLVKVDD